MAVFDTPGLASEGSAHLQNVMRLFLINFEVVMGTNKWSTMDDALLGKPTSQILLGRVFDAQVKAVYDLACVVYGMPFITYECCLFAFLFSIVWAVLVTFPEKWTPKMTRVRAKPCPCNSLF